MPLSEDVLAGMMIANIDAIPKEDRADVTKTYKALAKAFLDHIKAAGVITVAVTAGGTAPPGGGPVPVTGTGTGTIA
jgi:hypothetical protein